MNVDVSYVKTLIVISLFGIEIQSAETYQVSSRIRDKEESKNKKIHYHLIWETSRTGNELKELDTQREVDLARFHKGEQLLILL